MLRGLFKPLYIERASVNDKELLASADTVFMDEKEIKERGFYVVELKVWQDKELLRDAMRYLMLNFPVIEVTQGKLDISEQLNDS